MHCTNCGTALPASAKFCPSCGAAVAATNPKPRDVPPERVLPPGTLMDLSDRSPSRWNSRGCLIAIAVLIGLMVLAAVFEDPKAAQERERQRAAEQAATAKAKTDKEAAAEREEAEERRKGFHCLSGWDGSNRSLVAAVKRQLRDPDSFEHDETRIAPVLPSSEGKHPISMRYRARNGFGGMNVETAVGYVDPRTCGAELLTAG
jgi:hypothetical protein